MDQAVDVLQKIREPLSEYQKDRGIPKCEQISFTDLVKAICQHACNATITVFQMLYSLLPLIDGFLYLLRFILDRTIDILETEECKDKVIKSVVFLGQLIAIIILLIFIISLLLSPIVHLVLHFIKKVANLLYV